jgi:hypothetical protein
LEYTISKKVVIKYHHYLEVLVALMQVQASVGFSKAVNHTTLRIFEACTAL